MENPYFIVNPSAGSGSCEKKFALIRAELDRRGVSYTAVYSEEPGHTSRLAHAAAVANCGCIVAVGGDGTVREVAQELLHTGVPLGVLPFGTGNDFVKALGISTNPEDALALILDGEPRQIDAAAANDKIYINVAGFGLDVSVLQRMQRFKRKLGGISYILGLIHALAELRSYYVRVKSPEGCLEKEVILMAAGNGTHVGSGMMVTPEADLSDGLLDVCLVGKLSRRRIVANLPKLIKGAHTKLDVVQYFKVSELTVECVPPAMLQLDGEIIGETPVTLRILPGALTVLRPSAKQIKQQENRI